MRAMDIMTTDVITVDPDTTVQGLAALLAERGISGAPVVDASGRLVGVVSEGDLLHRAEIGTAHRHRERRRSWWLDHFASDLARELCHDLIQINGYSAEGAEYGEKLRVSQRASPREPSRISPIAAS